MNGTNLCVDVFCVLREVFFLEDGRPREFRLRPKRNTQDDPLDEYVAKAVSGGIQGAECHKSPGPLISPDFVVYRKALCETARVAQLKADPTRIVGIEVKKLERSGSGKIARATGLDYNTTPPCGTLRIYDRQNKAVDVPGFYLFVCLETKGRQFFVSALALCDGNILNEDFHLYLGIVGRREKEINLGTYGDGVNRNRPMLIFANPLGSDKLDHSSTLVSGGRALDDERVGLVYRIVRTTRSGDERQFLAYRAVCDVPRGAVVEELRDPFPQPEVREVGTQARGKFRLPINVAGQA